jgi:transposase InsO family protein
LLFVWLYRLVPSLLNSAVIILPDTILRWHRATFRSYLHWKSRSASYAHAVIKRLAAMGIRGHPIAPRSPWQNGHAERLIGSIRRECLDQIVIFGEAHLRQVLKAYATYYNSCPDKPIAGQGRAACSSCSNGR